MSAGAQGNSPPAGGSGGLPRDFKPVYQGPPLPPFYAAEMLREHIGKTVYVRDSGGRVRMGELASVPNLRETQTEGPPAEFLDERPLYLREIVAIAVYVRWSSEQAENGVRDKP